MLTFKKGFVEPCCSGEPMKITGQRTVKTKGEELDEAETALFVKKIKW